MSARVAVCPGTFDPITNGHLSVIRRAARMFDELVVSVAERPDKQPVFDIGTRLGFVEEACRDLSNVRVTTFTGLLVEHVREVGASVIVRGLRALSDFDREIQMEMMNRRLAAEIDTVFLATDAEYSFVSSSLVREVALLGGCVKGLVPPHVEQALAVEYGKR